ncbi:MAG: hypothetical protein A3G92_01370 [Deltaproteobacteria bacterium RIFCSPLOWO2_12_FULL_38_8]|nr:MAG: hypothetical protein A3G92_01370 [Deltaproteobacteria bacterium RIFCSPLOWO2_12_FULL_38_8]
MMKQAQILVSVFIILLFAACGGGDGGGSSAPTSSPSGDITVNPGRDGEGEDEGDGDTVGDGDTTSQACAPIDTNTVLKSYIANSNIRSFANAGSDFMIVNSDSTTLSSRSYNGKLEYWDAKTASSNQNIIWTPSLSDDLASFNFDDFSHCFQGMSVNESFGMTAAPQSINQAICTVKATFGSIVKFLMFRIHNQASTSVNPAAAFLRWFSNAYTFPIVKLNSTHIVGARRVGDYFIKSINVNENMSGSTSNQALSEDIMTVNDDITINGILYNIVHSIPFMRGSLDSSLTIASLYKSSTNVYRLELKTSFITLTSDPFSPTNQNDQFSMIISNNGELSSNRIYILEQNLKEIVVFNYTFSSSGSSNSIQINRRAIVLTPFASPIHKAISIGEKYIFALGQQSSTEPKVVSVINTNRETENEETIFETDDFEDLKKFTFRDNDNAWKSGIVLKKERELKLYRYDTTRCQ